MKKFFSFVFFLLLSCFVFAQENQNLSEYFDDGGIVNRKNVVSLNMVSTYRGNPSIHYERALGELFACDVSFGIITHNFTSGFFEQNYSIMPDTVLSGYSYSVNPRFYIPVYFTFLEYFFSHNDSYLTGYFWGFYYRNRQFEIPNDQLKFNEYFFHNGIQISVTERIMLELQYGIGYAYLKEIQSNKSDYDVGQLFHGKIGYKF